MNSRFPSFTPIAKTSTIWLYPVHLVENAKAIARAESQFPDCAKGVRALKRLTITRLLFWSKSQLLIHRLRDETVKLGLYGVEVINCFWGELKGKLGTARHDYNYSLNSGDVNSRVERRIAGSKGCPITPWDAAHPARPAGCVISLLPSSSFILSLSAWPVSTTILRRRQPKCNPSLFKVCLLSVTEAFPA